MTTRPILFSGPMVRALNDGRKTQTRRLLKPQPFIDEKGNFCVPDRNGKIWNWGQHLDGRPCTRNFIEDRVRFRAGDRLWVREAWRCNGWATDVATIMYRASEGGGYTAMTEQYPVAERKPLRVTTGWRPGIHMPRWVSRITLNVTDVRVERLHTLTPADAIAEGIRPTATSQTIDCDTADPRIAFAALWRSINGPDSWEANPWVVAVTFAVERCNVDHKAGDV